MKTGMVYLRSKIIKSSDDAEKTDQQQQQVTEVDNHGEENGNGTTSENENSNGNMAAMVCSLENRDECLMCGS